MSAQEKLPTYNDIENALDHASEVASPSESHGLLCGLICAGKADSMSASEWAHSAALSLEEGDTVTEQEVAVLTKLFLVTRDKLEEMAFDFELLLPDDDDGLQNRALELGNWCHGFIAGLQLSGITLAESLKEEDAKESMARINDISNIDYEGLEISEEDEIAYTEVVEYVRMAVLMIFADLNGKEQPPQMPDSSETIH